MLPSLLLPKIPASIRKRLEEGLNKFTAPLQTNSVQHQRNKRAEAALRSVSKPLNREAVDPITNRVSSKAGGLESYAYQSPEVNSKLKTRTAHELGFRRNNTVDPYSAYDARTDSRPGPAAVRRANIKAQIGRLMDEVKVGDRIEASAFDGDGRQSGRASMYKRVTQGALTANDDDYMSASRMKNNVWTSSTNQNGKGSRNLKQWDPSTLGNDLKKLAAGQIVRRLVQHPVAQAAITADEVIGGVTGVKPSEKVGEEFRKTTEASIRERLKRGQRFGSPVGPMPF